ncbi:MAG: DivIVA domain-containing protein [Reichenbachiella sp.]
MKITPLEIRQKSFEKAFRGINKEEVNAFLLSLSHEWERMLDENKGIKNNVEKLEKEVQKLREVETTLFKTLKTAEDTGASVVEQANKTAELHMRETQMNADAMVNDAKNQARAIIDKAEGQAKEILDEMSKEVRELEENYRIIENQRDNVVSQLKLLSGDVMSKVEKIKYQESGIETHLKKVKQMLRDTTERVEEKADSVDFDNIKIEKTSVKQEVKTPEKAVVTKTVKPEPRPMAPMPKKPEAKLSEGGDVSFFDQLED